MKKKKGDGTAGKIAKIAGAVFVLLLVLYALYQPVLGYLIQKGIEPFRSTFGCEPAAAPCCGYPFNMSNATYEMPGGFTDVFCTRYDAGGGLIGASAMVVLLLAIIAAIINRLQG
jgi:hypothetical protein